MMQRGSARVIQLAMSKRDAGRVRDHLLHDAWTRGAADVRGRLEPRLLEPVAADTLRGYTEGGRSCIRVTTTSAPQSCRVRAVDAA